MQEKTTKTNESKKEDGLLNLFNKIKGSETKTTRKVRLEYLSSCGCGSTYITIEREVPYDSPLKNGDKTDTLNDTDIVL